MIRSDNISIPEDAIIEWLGNPIPSRPGTGRYKRAETTRDNSGKTAAEIYKLPGMLTGTLGRHYRKGLISINGVSFTQ